MRQKLSKLFNRCFWLHAAGIIFVGLGFIGMALPVMPTTIFFILALACFSRTSPKFTNWLLTHPKFGHTLRAWQDHHVIPIKGKIAAALGMGIGLFCLILSNVPLWIILCVTSVKVAVMGYIVSKPSKVPSLESNSHS